MKKLTKVLSVVMLLAFVLSMTALTAFAAGDGKITLENPNVGTTYNLYKILNLESYDVEQGAYLYTVADGWKNFFEGTGAGLNYVELVEINGTKYVQWKDGAGSAADFAKAALEYAKANELQAVDSYTAEAVGAHEFTGLDLGYYLLDSSLGALCNLTTTDPTASITEKNSTHTVDKDVKEDSTGEWGETATYQIGDTVPFKVTINAKKGAENLVMHDVMEAGLTLNADSFVLTVDGKAMSASDYTVTTTGLTDGCTFEISFTKAFLDTIGDSGKTIVVEYSAVLNENAELHTNTNDNTTWVTAGDDFTTEHITVKVSTFLFDLVKTNASNKMLAGAEFELYASATAAEPIKLVKIDANTYRIATGADEAEDVTTTIVTTDAAIEIKGLDADANTTYYLKETKAPAGYNLLTEMVAVQLMTEGDNSVATNLEATIEGGIWVSGGVHIVNQTGTVLPETGGMGTTLFIAIGVAVAMYAAVMLVARKKTAGYR